MGLFDHLFKSKSPPSEEKVVEHPPAEEPAAPATSAKTVDAPARTPIPNRADPSAFLHPKSFVPRGAPSVTPAPRPSGISGPRTSERRVAPAGPPPAADEIVLTLGDVLSRIPTHYLTTGTHDPKRELRFKINDLSSDIARGRAAVPLSRIAQLVPDIFVKEIGHDEDTEVRLPLQKLVEQIGLLRSRPKVAPVVGDKTTRPVAADASSTPRVVDVEAKKESDVPVAERFRSVVPSPHAPAIVLGEQAFAGQRAVELKPAAEAPPPVILGPAPTVEPPAVPATVPSVAAPMSPAPVLTPPPAPVAVPPAVPPPPPVAATPAPVIPPAPIPAPLVEPKPTTAPAVVAVAPPSAPPVEKPKPAPPVSSASVVASAPEIRPPTPSTPRTATSARPGIVIDWSSDSPVIVPPLPSEAKVLEAKIAEVKTPEAKAPEAKVTEITVEPVAPMAAREARKLTSSEVTEVEPSEEKIHLSLAAILRHCPQEIIVGELPHVDDSVRITLPFAPIDRQLVKGQVEVSALRFVASLPEAFHKYFVAKVGVKVPIPLEEVFQNLPSPKHELASAPLVPLPKVLAPASEKPASVAPVAPVPPIPVPAVPEAAPAPAVAAAIAPSVPVSATPESKPKPAPAAEPVDEAGIPFSIFKPATPLAKPSVPASTPISSGTEAPSAPARPAIRETEAEPPPLPTAPVPEPPALAAPVDAPPLTASEANVPAAEIPIVPKLEQEQSTPEPAAEVIPQPPTPAPATGEPEPAPAGEESPKLVLQRPMLRPFVFPPPPIFGFAPPASAAPTEEPSAISSEIAAPVIENKEGATATVPAPEPVAEADATPTAEMIASALEGGAPETILPFSLQPVPFADLAETFAHETTYAPDLAEVVHVDVPVQESGEKPVVAETEAKSIGESADQKVAVPTAEPVVAEKQPAAPAEPTPAEQPAAVVEPVAVEQPAAVVEPLAAEEPAVSSEALIAEQPEAPAEPVEEPIAPVEAVDAEQVSEPVHHHIATVAEAVTAAATVAIAAEVISHKEHEPKVAGEQPEPSTSEEISAEQEEAPVSAEQPVAEQTEPPAPIEEATPQAEEPAPAEEPVAPAVAGPSIEATLPPAPVAEVPPAPIVEPPVAPPPPPAPERPTAAVPPTPPPLPLFPLPKAPVEPAAHLEVLPPPALPLRRFDQDAVQALFMTEETLDLPKISRLAASLPGVYACVIATRDQACTGGTLPEGFDLAALLGLAPRVGEAAGRMPIGQLKHFTLYGDAYSVSFFERNGLSLCAVHRPRSFVPGVREKLVALADELSR